MRVLGQNDLRFRIDAEIVQCGNQRPTVHLTLVDLLRTVVKARGIAQTNSVGGCEDAEIGVGFDHFVLVKQRQLAVNFQHALDHEHHVGTARIIFVEHNRSRVAQRPRQDAFLEIGNLLAVFQLDRILTDQVDPADVAIKVDPYTRPVQQACHLFDVGGFTRPVVALNHHAAVVVEAREDRHRGVGIEFIGAIQIGNAACAFVKAVHDHVGVDAKDFANGDLFGGFGCEVQ